MDANQVATENQGPHPRAPRTSGARFFKSKVRSYGASPTVSVELPGCKTEKQEGNCRHQIFFKIAAEVPVGDENLCSCGVRGSRNKKHQSDSCEEFGSYREHR